MSTGLLAGLLWIPFIIVALIAGLIYCIRGYRKGLWHALISLGAVVVSTVMAILFSRLIASALGPALAESLPLGTDGGAGAAMVKMLLSGMVSVAVSLVLFGLFMLIFTPVISWVAGIFLKKHLPQVNKNLKWYGLGVGAVTTLVFTLFLLSPVYGTLATAAPVVSSVLAMEEEGQKDSSSAMVADYFEGISDHLLVKVSGAGPVAWVYDGVSRMPVGSKSISVVEMSKAVKEAMSLLARLEQVEDPQEAAEISEKLIKLTREYFVDQDWFYALTQELVKELEKAAEDSSATDIAYVRTVLDLLEMPKSEFEETASAVLDFAQFALSKGLLTMDEDSDPMMVYESGVMQEMGRVFNSTDRLVELKKLMLAMMLEEAGLEMKEAMALLQRYDVGRLTEEADQLLEVEALLLPGLGPDIPPAVMILRHPGLGEPALEDVLQTVGFAEVMGYSDGDLDLTKQEQQTILEEVKKAAKLPFADAAGYETGLRNAMNTAESYVDYMN